MMDALLKYAFKSSTWSGHCGHMIKYRHWFKIIQSDYRLPIMVPALFGLVQQTSSHFSEAAHLPCGGYLLQTYDFASSPLGGPGPVRDAKVDWLMTRSGIRVHHWIQFEGSSKTFEISIKRGWGVDNILWKLLWRQRKYFLALSWWWLMDQRTGMVRNCLWECPLMTGSAIWMQ